MSVPSAAVVTPVAAAPPVTHATTAVMTDTEQDPLPTLYKHALESIFGFLSLRELSSVLAVSHSWLAAVKSMRGIGATIQRTCNPPAAVVCASALVHHIVEWDCWSASFTVADVASMSLRMRSLRSLRCYLVRLKPSNNNGATDLDFVFPPNLIKLSLFFEAGVSTANSRAAIGAVGRLTQLQSFFVKLNCAEPQLVSFASLQSLAHLTEFGFDWERMHVHTPSDAQVDEIRSLVHVQSLLNNAIGSHLLIRLLRPSHSLQWRSIIGKLVVDDELSALLPSLPTLTRLNACLSDTCDLAFFTRLPMLTRLELDLSSLSPAHVDAIAVSLQSCPLLTELRLSYIAVTSAQMSALLAGRGNMRKLEFVEADFDSLKFLSSGSLPRTLTHLTLDGCGLDGQLSVEELSHVHALQELTHLNIDSSFDEDLFDSAVYNPPSKLLPKLVSFTC